MIIAKPFLKVPPNVLTVIGLIFPALFFYFLLHGQYLFAILALAGNLFDTVDGTVARYNNKQTVFGFFLDSTLDRVSDFIMISAFGFAGLVRWELVIPTLGASFLISFIRTRASLAVKDEGQLAVGIIERTERIVFLGLTVFFQTLLQTTFFYGLNVAELVFSLLLTLSAITVAQRFVKTYEVLSK